MYQDCVKVSKMIASTITSKSSFLVGHCQWVYVRTKKEWSSFANRKIERNSAWKKKPSTHRFSIKVGEFRYIQPTNSHQTTRIMNGDVAQHGKKTKVYWKITKKIPNEKGELHSTPNPCTTIRSQLACALQVEIKEALRGWGSQSHQCLTATVKCFYPL